MLWEYVTGLFATYEDVEDFPRYLQSYVNRIYVGQAAPAQTGMGSPLRRGLANVAKQSQPLLGDAALKDLPAPESDEESRRWLHLGTQLLKDAGWAWPIPAELALDAASECDQWSVPRRRQMTLTQTCPVASNSMASCSRASAGKSGRRAVAPTNADPHQYDRWPCFQ